MPECYPINSFGHMLNPRLIRGVSINRLSTGFPLNICGNDTLALVIPECSPLKLALECFNRVTCGGTSIIEYPPTVIPECLYRISIFFIGFPLAACGNDNTGWIPNKACTHMPLVGNIWDLTVLLTR